ncbi:hypothetical protein DYBT9275_03286 [Dyadobacter sp. CECT 9275]|uniref:DUF2029 domain-containing protein n=1 Tax=Dyadobacter helix TaxID=2822344 RepID=A0A916JDA1_9BACT|nr:glycosyltransferase family 87 protein [Dyadobacter sp. CECT 9275]CAG5004038.1 hypothetical protein DYBT9275_03286 [Dyadobacter sp. CECT 9275]
MKRLSEFFSREKIILGVYILLSIVVGIQHYKGGPAKFNNFQIFRAAFGHLVSHQNLHLEYPKEYFDLFLYHPSFCIFFAPFSLLPLPVSLMLWLVCCSAALFYAIRSLPLAHHRKVFFWWFILFELVTSLHSQQTNPLIAAFGLLCFTFLEKGKTRWAALFPLLAFCIKGYGLIYAAMFLFYPRKGQYIGYSILWAAALALLPLPFTGTDHFLQVYRDWYTILIEDHQVNYGFSIMGLLKVWFPAFSPGDVTEVQLAGVVLFGITWLLCLYRKQYLTLEQRLLLLAYASLWVIVFNHAAESPTYVIAIPGVVLFHIVNRERLNPWSTVLIVLVFLFCILAPTDVYPPSLRRNFFQPYLIKVIPCVLVWTVLQIQLLLPHHEN